MHTRSRVASSVQSNSSSKPSVTVLCHRYKPSNYFKSQRNHKNISTNEMLRKGGSLPSVCPEDRQLKRSFDVDDRANQSAWRTKCPSTTRNGMECTPQTNLNDNNVDITGKLCESMKEVSIEKKVERLSDELSKVQEALKGQYSNSKAGTNSISDDQCINGTKDFDKPNHLHPLRSISAREYLFIVTEMNEDMNSVPYDPDEFTEGSKVFIEEEFREHSHSGMHDHFGCINNLGEADKAEILHAIQSELAEWRQEQVNSRHAPL